jgi:hypothetical protein
MLLDLLTWKTFIAVMILAIVIWSYFGDPSLIFFAP